MRPNLTWEPATKTLAAFVHHVCSYHKRYFISLCFFLSYQNDVKSLTSCTCLIFSSGHSSVIIIDVRHWGGFCVFYFSDWQFVQPHRCKTSSQDRDAHVRPVASEFCTFDIQTKDATRCHLFPGIARWMIERGQESDQETREHPCGCTAPQRWCLCSGSTAFNPKSNN